MSLEGACEVCGRTFLVGEKIHRYVSVEGRHEVCELCLDRVPELGWLPADQEGAVETLRAAAARRPGLLGRLFARRAEEDERRSSREEGLAGDELDTPPAPAGRRRRYHEPEVDAEPPAPAAARGPSHELETESYDVEAEWRGEDRPSDRRPAAGTAADGPGPGPEEPRGRAADLPAPDEVPEPETSPAPAAPAPAAGASPAPLPDPAGRGMRPRRLQPDLSPTSRFERAITRFNGSDAGRTVAGLTRTLGAPSVSVGNLAGTEDVIRVTVAWELTWYQWGVDLGDELRPVFQLAKGHELGEIDAAARQWNASAQDGRIVMVAPRRRAAENGRPVHR